MPNQPACLVCDCNTPDRLTTLQGHDIYQCRTCGLTFCYPLPSVESDSSNEHAVLTEEDYTTELIRRFPERAPRYDALARNRHEFFSSLLGKKDFRMLEVGCGIAGIADELTRLGVDYLGIDIDERVIASARARGANVRCTDLFDLSLDGCFDVIMFSQVLEHIRDPRPFLSIVDRLLSRDGVVLCDIPNHESLSSWMHRLLPLDPRRYGAIDLPHHAIAYRKRTLNRLFEMFFDVKVFDATSDHPLWGQATPSSLKAKVYYRLAGLMHRSPLLVALGRKRSSSQSRAEPTRTA